VVSHSECILKPSSLFSPEMIGDINTSGPSFFAKDGMVSGESGGTDDLHHVTLHFKQRYCIRIVGMRKTWTLFLLCRRVCLSRSR
jgi:hypothetical protein